MRIKSVTSDPDRTRSGSDVVVEHRRAMAALWMRYVLGRLGVMVAIIATIALMSFLVVRLVPGDPAIMILGLRATPDQVETVRAQLGLDQPWILQLVNYFASLLTFDLGNSFRTGLPVSLVVSQRLPTTAMLTLGGMLVVLIVGFSLGLLAGMASARSKRGSQGSGFSALTSFIGAIPEYIMGTVLILVFGIWLRVLPVQGGGTLLGFLMPSLAVGLAGAAVMARIVRNETLSVMSKEYILAARAKRLPWFRTLLVHVLPNVVTSSLTLAGLLIISLLGGAVITENVFNLPGLGTEIVGAIVKNDYPIIQGVILVLGVIAAAVTFLIDVLLGVLDPRLLQKRGW